MYDSNLISIFPQEREIRRGYDVQKQIGKRRHSSAFFDTGDDDYAPTVKEKERKLKARKKEVQQRMIEGDFLDNASERNKAFRSRKDALISKIKETDSVCATRSLLIILNIDNDAIYYHGDPQLVSQLFTNGVSVKNLSRNYNIRMVSVQFLANLN